MKWRPKRVAPNTSGENQMRRCGRSSEKLLVGDADALEKKVSVWEKKVELVPKKDEALEKFGRLAFGAQGGDQEAAGVDQLDAVGDEFG